ncbi:MAG: proline dehydrogenase family protein [Methanomicrobiales archaeon]|nr:proline dehydrogenase family protein [Methanomicrobiales archaeon]
MDASHRWTLPDQASALAWVTERKSQKIRCTLALLQEYARTMDEAQRSVEGNIACIQGIAPLQAGASLSLKLSAIGSIFDPKASLDHVLKIAREAAQYQVPLELDMEGKGSVDLTINAALACRKEHPNIIVALQSYLRRTGDDIQRMVSQGIGVRLVKGAYLGDYSDFTQIQQMTEQDCGILKALQAPFSIGTHDPVLIDRIIRVFDDERSLVEFGFLKGLSEMTKVRLTAEGWRVSEYVPFGPGGDAYVYRRERYLQDLGNSGRAPAP